MTWGDDTKIIWPTQKLAQFDYHFHHMDYDPKKNIYGKGNDFAFVTLMFHLTRLLNFHITSTYIPSILLVSLGYTSLFIPADAVPGRVAMGMLSFLALTTMNNSVKSSLPKVSYMTYMDIWVAVCLLFVFFTNLVSICEMALKRSGKEGAGRKLNRVSKIIIPILFILFNAVYWPIILTHYFKDKRPVEYHISYPEP